MKNLKFIYKKVFISSIIFIFFITSFPFETFSQTGDFTNINNSGAQNSGTGFSNINNTSAGSLDYNPGSKTNNSSFTSEVDPSKGGLIPTQSQSKGSNESNAAADALSCSVGAIIGNALTAVVSKGIDSLLGTVLKEEVPTKEGPHRAKEVGSLVVWGIPILPSWDSIAYCLANTIITYVSDSTIAWIQSGFEGKPAFVDDPTKLFQDISDYEMGNFLQNLGGGFLCEPFEAYVTTNLINSYTNNYSNRGRCTLDTVQGNVESFLSGDSFDYNSYFAVTQNPANNPYGSYLLAEAEARNRIELGIGPIKTELDWGNGYFSWKAKDGPNAGKTVTPGSVIETQLEQRLGLAPDRLVMAEKFDQVVSTLVNYLIKTALTETLGAVKGSSN